MKTPLTSTQPIPFARILGKLILFRWPDYVHIVLETVFFYGLELGPGLLMRRVFDLLAADRAAPAVWPLLAILFAVLVGRWASVFGWAVSEARVAAAIETLLRRNMLAHIMTPPPVPGAGRLPGSAGEAISRFRDDAKEYARFLTFLPDMPTQVLTIISMLVVMAGINLKLTVVAIVPIALSLLAANASSGLVRRSKRATQEALGAVTGSLGEILGAVQAIKLGDSEAHVVNAFERAGEARRAALLRITLVLELLKTFSWNSAAFATAAMLIAATLTGDVRRMSVGDLALFVTYFNGLNFLIGFFGDLMARYRQAEVGIKRMAELLAGLPPAAISEHHDVHEQRDPDGAPAPALSAPLRELDVRGLTYLHPGSEAGISDATFTLARGGLTVITGRVGSGKTTLLRALLGLVPAAGEVRWNGVPVARRDSFFQPPHSAYVPQVPRLFSDSVRENILMGLPVDARLDDAIRDAVFERDVAGLDHGLETLVGVRGTKISGGQMQRAAAARAFVRRPELIVVDDVSSALDVETEVLLWERVLAQSSERTVLAVSHRPPALERAGRIILLKDGRVHDEGTLAELLARSEEMRAVYRGE